MGCAYSAEPAETGKEEKGVERGKSSTDILILDAEPEQKLTPSEPQVEVSEKRPRPKTIDDGCDDELENELHNLVHSKKGASIEGREVLSNRQGNSNQLRERTNTIGSKDEEASNRRKNPSESFKDKENVFHTERSEAALAPSTGVARRSSILQLIEESQFDDDFDSDSDSNYRNDGAEERQQMSSYQTLAAEDEDVEDEDEFSLEQEKARRPYILDSEYKTTAMDNLYDMKIGVDADIADIAGIPDIDDTDTEHTGAIETNLDLTDVSDLDQSFGTAKQPVRNLDTLDGTDVYNTLEGSMGATDGTGALGESNHSSEAQSQSQSQSQSLGITQNTFDNTVSRKSSMVETLDTTLETLEEGEVFNTSDSQTPPLGAGLGTSSGDKLDLGNSKTMRANDLPIDTYELTEEDKVWRSLTKHYASLNSTDTIDTHHTLISQDTNTLDTHHTIMSQNSRSGPQTAELEDTDMDTYAASKRDCGWNNGYLATNGTLMLGESHLSSLPESDPYPSSSSFDKTRASHRSPSVKSIVMDAGDLILEDEIDFF